MTDRKLFTIRGPKFNAARREALDATGNALKLRQIDFFRATELSDRVKAGQDDEALEALSRFAHRDNLSSSSMSLPE